MEIKNLLEKLSNQSLHVHEINHSEGYKDFNYPIALLATSTHFVMCGADIVHIGTIESINKFVDRKEAKWKQQSKAET